MLIQQQIEANDFETLIDNTNDNNVERTLNYIKTSGGIDFDKNEILFKRYHDKRERGVELDHIIERTILIMGHDRFIYYILNKHFGYDQDLYSIGKIGLIKAIDNFCFGRQAFATFATKVIINEILMYKRRQKTHIEGRCVISSLDGPPNEININDGGRDGDLYSIIPDDEDFTEDIINKCYYEYIESLFKYLTPVEQKIAIYGFGLFGVKLLTQTEIAKKVNLAQSYVSRLLKQIPQKLFILINGDSTSNKAEYQKLIKKQYGLVDVSKLDNDDRRSF